MVKILIVDDEGYEREILADILAKHFAGEAQLRLAENGRQALDMAALWGAELILMDIEMPGIGGIEAAKQIVTQRPESKIIFVTAYSLFTYAREAVKLGASDYILKPVVSEDVVQAVRRAIDQLETQRQLKKNGPGGGGPCPVRQPGEDQRPDGPGEDLFAAQLYALRHFSGFRQRNSEYQRLLLFRPVQAVLRGKFCGISDGAADECGQGAAAGPSALYGRGCGAGGLRKCQLFHPGL